MNGTLDLLDSFFGSITGIWGRIASFFVTCWLGFALGVLAASTSWTSDYGFQMMVSYSDWIYVPVSWMFMCVATCFHWWGFPHALFIIGIAFAIFYTEANLCQTLCSLVVVESWYWWFAFDGGKRMIENYGAWDWGKWYPFHTVMIFISGGAAWLWWHSWRVNHPADD